MYSSNDDDSDDYDDDVEEKKSESNLALRKYVRIIKKRVLLKILEDEVDLSPQIEEIRKEANMRKNMQQKERENAEEESIMSTKSPTRELASKISAEANSLLKHHNGIGVQTLIGGTRFKVDERRLETDPCQIVVATLGRLLDHIENKSDISEGLMGLQKLVLDEADHFLDLGFQKDMEKIVDCLPRKRQSLLFSATIPKEVRRISQLVLEREYAYIDTLGIGCLETHAKVIDFCATSMMTSLMCSLFREMKLNVREIHSEKPPLYRTRISNEFKESKGLILITSDAFQLNG
ncbi:hypothetical protein RD792_005385 [Penstemon davidsonii]|uniref:ATP-dependent RNA helicase n=1 Tax=Penstemon davidsonii TaxID=160366 RepID=A0ABR0DK03_9LAMI|nr:hypothetical protein RD792_005385 [Penstemon davidsonii]